MEKLSLLDMVASRKAVAGYDIQPGWGVLNPPTYNSSSANWGGLANLPPANYISNPSNLEGGDIISSSYATTITTSSSLLGRVFMPPYSPSATLLSPNYQLTTDKLAVLPSRRSWQEFLSAPDLPFTANTATPQKMHCWSRSKKPNITTTTTSSSTTTTTTTTSSSSNSTSFCHQELISFQQPAANLEAPFSSNLVDTSHDIVSKRVVIEDCCLSDISANKLASQIMVTAAAAAATAISLPQSSSGLELVLDLVEKPNHISSTKWSCSPLACMDETKTDETQIQPFLNPNTIAAKKLAGTKRSRSSTDPLQLEAVNQDMTCDLDVAMEEGVSCVNNKVLEVDGNRTACTTSSGAATKSSSQSLESKQSMHYSSGGSSRSKRSRHPLGPALNTNLKPRAKQGTANDPQIVAARNRRERINARLKILQDLVPNGSKVDLVTMLEKAVNYVKFLQLQVQVLSKEDQYNNNNSCIVDI